MSHPLLLYRPKSTIVTKWSQSLVIQYVLFASHSQLLLWAMSSLVSLPVCMVLFDMGRFFNTRLYAVHLQVYGACVSTRNTCKCERWVLICYDGRLNRMRASVRSVGIIIKLINELGNVLYCFLIHMSTCNLRLFDFEANLKRQLILLSQRQN